MTEVSDQKLQSVLSTVRKLIERADHPNTPPAESEACRAKADAMMFKYKIDLATAEASGRTGGSVTEPGLLQTNLYSLSSDFSLAYRMIASEVMHHVGARGTLMLGKDRQVVLHAVGMPSDLNYLEVLLTSCILEFSKRLEPKYDPSKSDAENIYAMRSAGMERNRIARLVFGDWETENEMKGKTRKVTRIFKQECERRGESAEGLTGRGVSVKAYRKSYAIGFTNEIANRLSLMRMNRGEAESGLVLADLKERVEEAYYNRFPHLRPDPDKKVKPRRLSKKDMKAHEATSAAGINRGREAAREVHLGDHGKRYI